MSKRIVIVGGGYIGTGLAKALDKKAEVILIEQRTHFVHAPAMIRALVEPSVLDRALIPYDGLLKYGKFIQARVEAVDEDGVLLVGGERVDADYIMVATGSNNALPFKPNALDINGLKAKHKDLHQQLSSAKTVTIVGAGAVGTELAGEIAHFMPEKKVTLVSSDKTLFKDMPEKLGRELSATLKAAGVELKFGERVANLASLTEPYVGTVKLDGGAEWSADLIVPAIGSRAVSSLLEGLPNITKSTADRVKTDEFFRPSSLPNVFAAGDVADIGDAMTIVAASRQLSWLEKTLTMLLDGKKMEDVKPYQPWKTAPILIPLGPKKGNSFLVAFTAGGWITSLMKGKDLFLSKYNKLLGRD